LGTRETDGIIPLIYTGGVARKRNPGAASLIPPLHSVKIADRVLLLMEGKI
jgi:hypothetical protein